MPISIVMPTYNGMKYLEQAIQSVLSQTWQDWELIISDDGSKDGTREYLSQLSDPRIIVHLQTKNLGIFGNLNFLFSQVKNDLTQILCQDDYLRDSEALARVVAHWATLPAEIAFLRSSHSLDSNSRLSRYEKIALPSIIRPDVSDLYFFVFGCIPGNLSNVSVRSEEVKKAGWFRPDLPYAGDFEFWSRLGRSRPWAISAIPVAFIRGHAEQASFTLNLRGELMPQAKIIVRTLYENLVAKGYPAPLLRLMVAITYSSRFKDQALKEILRGHGTSMLRRVYPDFDAAPYSFSRVPGWILFFASLGGRLFSLSVARQLLKRQPLSGRQDRQRAMPGLSSIEER